ncbi:unnamed protein product [Paramecium pentaurelia]|uniref:Transmembrane protein n=1 Tax=Paramecium pentaurelia TaxID=43138 RepID=A0A8S1SN81_9CILI|nr:unnamed protein product [Paramecium pentaurelia]
MQNQEVSELVKSQVIHLLNDQTKSQILQSKDRDDTEINNVEFEIDDVNEQQCYDAQNTKSESKIDQQINKIQDLKQKKEELEQKLRNQNQQVNQLEEKLKKQQESNNVFARQLQSAQENMQDQQWIQKQSEYQQILHKYEEVLTQENDKELKDIYKEYYNKSNKARNQQQRIQNSIELEKQLNLEFDQVNKEIDEIKNILDKEINEDNINDLQQLLISNNESIIETMEQQLENKKQNIEVIQEDIINLSKQLNEAEDKFRNIFIIYNEQRKLIKELMVNNNQVQKPIQIGKQKVNSKRSSIKMKNCQISSVIQNLCSGFIILFGGFLMFILLQDIYISNQQQQYYFN